MMGTMKGIVIHLLKIFVFCLSTLYQKVLKVVYNIIFFYIVKGWDMPVWLLDIPKLVIRLM